MPGIFRMAKGRLGPLIGVIMLGLLLGCARSERTAHTGIVRLSDDEVKGLDPQKISDLTSLRVAADQFEGLTRYRGDGRPELGLARTMRCAPDGLLCRFTLRDNLRFSDGHAITAAIFAQGFARLRDPKTAAPVARLFEGVESIAADGPATVVVTLRRPLPWLADLLAQPALAALPMHRIAAAGDRWTSERPLVTSGAYRLTGWRLGDRLTLGRNPVWHDRPAPSPLIVWQPAEDKLAALRRFRAHEADTVSDIPTARLDWARAHLPGAVRIAPYAGTYYLAFNTRKPPFDDVRVRRALSMAVDRRWIATRLMGTGESAAPGRRSVDCLPARDIPRPIRLPSTSASTAAAITGGSRSRSRRCGSVTASRRGCSTARRRSISRRFGSAISSSPDPAGLRTCPGLRTSSPFTSATPAQSIIRALPMRVMTGWSRPRSTPPILPHAPDCCRPPRIACSGPHRFYRSIIMSAGRWWRPTSADGRIMR